MEQTNRTILFEELNPDKENLLSYIIQDEKAGITDETLHEINRNLAVTSFEQCIEKFKPVLYLLLDTADRRVICTRQVQISRQAMRDGYHEIVEICVDENHTLLQYFIKKISGSPDFGAHIADLIFPIQKEKEFRELYTNVQLLFVSGKTQESVIALQKLCGKYDDGLTLLHLLLILAEEELEDIQKNHKWKPVMVEDHEGCQVEITGVSDNFFRGHIQLDAKEADAYEAWVEETLERFSLKNRELWLHLLKIRLYGARHQEMRLAELHEEYLAYRGKIIETFWSICEPLLEKLLGVYTYFNQYQVSEALMQPELVIANFVPEQITNQSNKKKLQQYLNSVNEKNHFADTIWYAIVPRLKYHSENEKAGIRQRFEGNRIESPSEVSNTLESFDALTEILTRYQIQTFVSPVINRRTMSRWLCEHGAADWCEYEEALLSKGNPAYRYPCFPNFALSADLYQEMKNGRHKVWLKLPGIEASYVAAGMYAAFQCPQFLQQQFGRYVDPELPGVSFRINEKNRNEKIPATLKAGIFSLPKEVTEEVKRRCVGIFFAPAGGKEIILIDRTGKDWHGEHDCVSTVQTLTYLERKIRTETQDFKPELVERFFEKRPGSLMEAWCRNTNLLNAVFGPGEGIEYTLDEERKECIFEVCFFHADCRRKVYINR